MTTLSERAMLVTLKISQWTARKLDRKETTAVNRAHGLTAEIARVNKKLLPFGAELERVHQATGAIRKEFAQRTLPWGIDGVNILKASSYVNFTQLVNTWQQDWSSAVGQFIEAYPQLRQNAYLELGTMFDAEDYPTVEELRGRFAFQIRFLPVPDDRDWRVDVGDEERARLQEDIRRRLAETELEAMNEAWRRIKEVVVRAQERLSAPDAIFRDTLVENAIELCGVLPSLNIADDPKLEASRQALERALAPYVGKVDTLRNDPLVRKDVARQMDDIMKKMSAAYRPVALAEAA